MRKPCQWQDEKIHRTILPWPGGEPRPPTHHSSSRNPIAPTHSAMGDCHFNPMFSPKCWCYPWQIKECCGQISHS
jgi:hypothetical protein